MKSQRGGTFLGFILGLVAGLGVALAVAVYVTKVPLPFMNKGQSRTADQDAAEEKKNKDWDPNAPLYGKNPAKPTAAPKSGENTVPNADKSDAASAKAESKPAVTADPLGDLARSKSAEKSADPFNYFVQAGAFRTPEDAEQQRIKLSLMGLPARVSEREQSGRIVYRVRLGPFDKKDDADKVKVRLDTGGLEATLVRVQK
jgi:cell division protein FtsN